MNNEECLICKAPLIYSNEDKLMECAICHKQEPSKTACVNGHYVCNECHSQGLDKIYGICLTETSRNPIDILNKMMASPQCHMHGPEHHVMVGMALLTAFKNAGGKISLEGALSEMRRRGACVPGGACGFWGACGAGLSTGMFLSIATGATPLGGENFGLSHQMTARSLGAIGAIGGPRCCKRDSYLSVLNAVDFVKEHLGIEMERPKTVTCGYSQRNNQCIGGRCPFYRKPKVAFVCVHNSCRSQIAEALGRHLAGDVFESYSAGTEIGARINPDAVRVMKKAYGLDMEAGQRCKPLSELPPVDVVITMGCNVACPSIPCRFREDWGLEDPTGQEEAAFLRVAKEIEDRILNLRQQLKKPES